MTDISIKEARERLRRKVESDPDNGECEARSAPDLRGQLAEREAEIARLDRVVENKCAEVLKYIERAAADQIAREKVEAECERLKATFRDQVAAIEDWNLAFLQQRARAEAAEAQRDLLQGQVERLKRALPDCATCGGSGYIEEAAKTSGANQHSACRHVCDDCEGLGVEL